MSPTKMLERVTPLEREVHAFLKANAQTFDAKRPARLDPPELVGLISILDDAIASGDWDRTDAVLLLIPAYASTLALPRHAGHERHLGSLRNAVTKRCRRTSVVHVARLRRIIRIVANDDPLTGGERVSVTRTKHGWFDGRLHATVVEGSGGSLVRDDAGDEHEIGHRRDVRRVPGARAR